MSARTRRTGFWLWALALGALGVAWAGDPAVRITLSDGRVLEGSLQDFEERVYRVKTAAGVEVVKERDVARVEFVKASPAKDRSAPALLQSALAASAKDGSLAPLLKPQHFLFKQVTLDHQGRRREEEYLIRVQLSKAAKELSLEALVLSRPGGNQKFLSVDENVPTRLVYRFGPDARVTGYKINSSELLVNARVQPGGELQAEIEIPKRGRKVNMTPRWDRDVIPSLGSYFLWAPLSHHLPPHLGFREAPPKGCDSAQTVTVMRRLPGLEEHPSGCLVQAVSHRKRRLGEYRGPETTILVAAERLGANQRRGQVLSIRSRAEGEQIEGERIDGARFARLQAEWKLSDPPAAPTAAYPKVTVARTVWHERLAKAIQSDALAGVLGTRHYVQRFEPNATERAAILAGPTRFWDPASALSLKITGARLEAGVAFSVEVERPIGSGSSSSHRYVIGADGHLLSVESTSRDGADGSETKAKVVDGYLIGTYTRWRGTGVRSVRSFREPWKGHVPESLAWFVLPALGQDAPQEFELCGLRDLNGSPFLGGGLMSSAYLTYTQYALAAGAERLVLKSSSLALPRGGADSVLVARSSPFRPDDRRSAGQAFRDSRAIFVLGGRILGSASDPRQTALEGQVQADYRYRMDLSTPKALAALRAAPEVKAAGLTFARERLERSLMLSLAEVKIAQETFRERDAEQDGRRDFAQSLTELRAAGLLSALPQDEAYGYKVRLIPSTQDGERRFRILATPPGEGAHLVVTESGYYRSQSPVTLTPDGPLPKSLVKVE